MKKRTYKNHNRAIKLVAPDQWECRLIPKSGDAPTPPFSTPTKDGAFNWLRGGGTKNITPDYQNSRARRKSRRSQKGNHNS